MQTSSSSLLSGSELETFASDGYLVLPGVFDEAEVAAMAAEADRILELLINTSLALGEGDARLDARVMDGSVHVRKVQPVNDLSQVLTDACNDERLLGPMRQLMGDEPVLMEEKLNYKQSLPREIDLTALALPNATDSFPLHHDWGYYNVNGYPESTLSSAITIDECSGRGPLRMLPGTHREDAPTLASGDGQLVEGSEFESRE